jgi:hypothetical protein
VNNPSLRHARNLGLGLVAVAVLQVEARAQFDASVGSIEVTQAIQTGNTPLVGDRSTFIRVTTMVVNPPASPVMLDGVMRVFINGIEDPDSPFFSNNGPYGAKQNPNSNNLDQTLNFFYLPPTSNNVVFEVEINPAGPNFVAEPNTANNKGATPQLSFQERAIPEFAYVPIDYRPGGGATPNLPPESLIRPSKGDNFIQGIFPVGDVEYHRVDAASKLWTNSLSGSGTGLLNSMLAEWNLMFPKPDFYYGWVPGSLPYNGVSFLNSPVSMGNTQSFKNQRTYAHEVGHNIGRSHVSSTLSKPGIDVEHHLNLPQSNNIGQLKQVGLNDIMVAGLNTNQAWVVPNFYNYAFNHNKFKPSPVPSTAPSIFVAANWNEETGAVTLEHVFELPSGVPSTSAPAEETVFRVRAYTGGDLVRELALARANTQNDACCYDAGDTHVEPTVFGINGVIVQGAQPYDRVEIVPNEGIAAQTVTLVRSANAPVVSFTSPGPDGDVSAGQVTVSWTASDADGDPLTYYLLYSNDGFRFSPLATGITVTEVEVDLRDVPAFIEGTGFFQVIASDGLNSTTATSAGLTGGGNLYPPGGSNDPWIDIMTPDPNYTYQKGTNVILHSSGWDLEDRALRGSSIVWSSDLDGFIGTGRVLTHAGFSVGTHQITATATDSAGQTASDTNAMVITDRGLPGQGTGPVVYCTPGTSASNCNASISATGTPSATASSGFTLDTTGVEGSKDGLYFFGSNGRQANPWGSGTSFQCVIPPVVRAGLLTGVGTSGQCDGSFSQDLNALWCPTCPNPAKNPGSGTVVQAQTWYRDPFNTSNQTTSLSDAVEFTVMP